MKYNLLLSWLVTPLYIILFFGILLAFQLPLMIARLVSYDAFHRTLVLMCQAILKNLYLTAGTVFSYRKLRALPSDRPLLIVSNHQSMYDVPMIIDAFAERQPRFIAKRELARWIPSISFALRNNKSALINRTDRLQSIEAIRRIAADTDRENGALSLFPEGTRARDGTLKKFKPAGFTTLLESMPRVLIVPVAIGRSWELLRYNLLPIPARVKVSLVMLEPIEPAGREPGALLESIEADIRKIVAGLELSS